MSNSKNLINKNKKKTSPYFKLFFSGVGSCVLYFFLIAFSALLVTKLNLSDSLYMSAGLIGGCLSGFIAGYISVIPFNEKGIIYGSAGGIICAVLCGSVSFAINGGKAGKGIFLLCGLILIFSAIGGFLSSGKKRKRK